MKMAFTEEYALERDAQDALNHLRKEFHIPPHGVNESVYFTGNSLGLQPKKTREYIDQELEDWQNLGVEGHFHAKRPWMPYHEFFSASLSRICGALPSEVVAMGTLTNNLHLAMVSFYRPSGKRTKILCEAKAFPSDQYALASQLRFHGFDSSHLIEIAPRTGEHTIRIEDFYQAIEDHGEEIALMMVGGVNYYTGQVFPMKDMTAAARAKGITVGWDLAHAMGNIPLHLHDWGVDFAAWCSYKYMNSGPGSVAGLFIHERHHGQADIPRFEGWWGHDKSTRFTMPDKFIPMPTAEAWQLSNAPVFAMAPHRASLDLFDSVDLKALQAKGKELAAYLRFVIEALAEKHQANFEIITPANPEESGCQVSVLLHGQGRPLFEKLMAEGVIVDWREPNVIRMAPVPMYNSFHDIYRFGEIFDNCLSSK